MSDRSVLQALWEQTPDNVFRVDLTQTRADELNALLAHSVPFGDVCRINYGAQISSKEPGAFGRDKYLAMSQTGMRDPRKFYEGGDMRPFWMEWRGRWVDWRPELFYGPRTPTLFENHKLSVRHISGEHDTFVAWVDEGRYFTDHGVIHAVPYHVAAAEPAYKVSPEQTERSRKYPLFYMLGVVMSKPILQYYRELYATGSLQGWFSHVYPETVKGLPVPELHEEPVEPPDGWNAKVESATAARSIRRLLSSFASRGQVAFGLAATARRRQDLERVRVGRERDFLDWLTAHGVAWRWQRGESLESPPSEDEFLARVGREIHGIAEVAAARDQFRAQTAAAAEALFDVEALQWTIDALSAHLFSEAP
jgi:TaqI-like C-terminal specificity domain